jgi:hypothetical protein
MQIDEQLDDISIEEIAEGTFPLSTYTCKSDRIELPENAPRYVVISYELVHPTHHISQGGADDVRNTQMDVYQIP